MFTISKTKAAALTAEFLGTALLVMVALVMTETTGVAYFIATSLALALAVIVLFFGPVSGAHVNPAITFGMWTARKMGTLRAATYIAAQLLGGLAAWQLYEYLTDKSLPAKSVTYSTPVLVAEVVGTAILALGVTAAVTRGFDSLQSAVANGAAIFTGVLVAATASAAFINPAIALGERSWSSVYVLGPLVGGLVGVNLYVWLFAPSARSAKKK
jgi:glycerol uptake facilitator-like aquaporin